MTSSITEWEFTADAASWINEAIAKSPSLPFSRAKCEQRGSGSMKRRDLTLLDKNQVLALTGEVKLPWQKDGGSPYIEKVVRDARQKAQRGTTAGAVNAADSFRDEILSLRANNVTERYRARLVRQGDLWHEGYARGRCLTNIIIWVVGTRRFRTVIILVENGGYISGRQNFGLPCSKNTVPILWLWGIWQMCVLA